MPPSTLGPQRPPGRPQPTTHAQHDPPPPPQPNSALSGQASLESTIATNTSAILATIKREQADFVRLARHFDSFLSMPLLHLGSLPPFVTSGTSSPTEPTNCPNRLLPLTLHSGPSDLLHLLYTLPPMPQPQPIPLLLPALCRATLRFPNGPTSLPSPQYHPNPRRKTKIFVSLSAFPRTLPPTDFLPVPLNKGSPNRRCRLCRHPIYLVRPLWSAAALTK